MPENSTPGWYDLQVPTTAEWNASYAVKVDAANGYAANLFVDGLLLDHDPLVTMEAATKHYVDALVSGGGTFIDAPDDGFTYGRLNAAWTEVLPISGGIMQGPLYLAQQPQASNEAATKSYVDTAAGGGIPEAPNTHLAYGRMDTAWTRVLAITGDVLDCGNF